MKPNSPYKDVDLELFDIIDYLEDRGIDYLTAGSKNTSAGWISISCVFCGDRSNHMGINLESNLCSCFKCGKKGSVLILVQAIDNCGYNWAVKTIDKFVLKDFSHLVKKERTHAERTILPGGTSDNFLPIHDKYLTLRRFDRKFLQRRYDIMSIGPTCDDWKFRICIPVFQGGNIVTFVARDTTGKSEIKYKNCPAERCVKQVKDCLYGIDQIREGDSVILVEGIFDAWRIGTGAVCTFGTQVTDEQIRVLASKRIKNAFVMFDSDATSKATTLCHCISSVVANVEQIELLEGDPDNLDEDEVWNLKRDLNLK